MTGHHDHRPDGHRHHDHQQGPGGQGWGDLGAHLELEAEVLSPCLDEAVSVLQALVRSGPEPIRRIVDVGCGPGVVTTALAKAFPNAAIIALDRAPALLAQVRGRADHLGVGHRVTTVPTDLDAGLGALDQIDLAWVGMVLHHLADPARLLRELHGSLLPGGLMAVVEFGPPTRTLPEDLGLGPPGFTRRHAEALAVAVEAHRPVGGLHAGWPETLQTAGFERVDHRTIMVDLPSPLSETARRWAWQGLQRSAAMVHERLSPDDQATLAILTDPTDRRSVMHRNDVEMHVGRSLYVVRKPA